MIAKTTKTILIMALFSLVGLAIPAGVSQTAFAQTVVEEAVGDTVLDGFFDDNTNEEEATDTESQELAQQQDQDADQQQDQEISQDETATQGNNAEAGDNTGTIGQNIEDNEVEGADCGEALICFGNDIVADAEQDQDASVHDVSEANTATFGADDADNTAIQDLDQDQDQRAANFRLDFEFDEECLAEATGGEATADTGGDAEPSPIEIEVGEAAGGSATAVQDCLFGESSQSETSEETTTQAPSNSILELDGI